MTGETVYLSSLESVRFEPVRKCVFLETLMFDTGKAAARVALHPGVSGQDFDYPDDIDTVILTTRHEGASISPIEEYPCFVFICVPRSRFGNIQTPIRADDLQIIGWGELYRTHADAANHVFG